jgi:hypothetical protein
VKIKNNYPSVECCPITINLNRHSQTKVLQNIIPLNWGLEIYFLEKSSYKYFFMLCGSYSLCHIYSILPLEHKNNNKQYLLGVEKSLMSIEQSLMAGPNCQAGWGKDDAAANLGQVWLL